MDTIFIRDLRLSGKHGVTDRERTKEQDFLIDITAEYDVTKAAASDELRDTVDYGRFRDIARDIVEKDSFCLIEKLAEEIAQRIMRETEVASVEVRIRKPGIWDNGIPGVSIRRTRS